MVVVSYSGREINAKIVYYGPGLSGKTTNLEKIYESVPETNRGRMVSMKTQTDRTLFFDLLPLDLGELQGMKTRFLLYTVPGQVYYNATRKLVLKGVDALVFVADSSPDKMGENKESLANLEQNLKAYGLELKTIPWVLQYNKRDLPNALPIAQMNKELNRYNVPTFEGQAASGVGVFETLRGVSKILLSKISKDVIDRDKGSLAAPPRVPAEEAKQMPAAVEENQGQASESAAGRGKLMQFLKRGKGQESPPVEPAPLLPVLPEEAPMLAEDHPVKDAPRSKAFTPPPSMQPDETVLTSEDLVLIHEQEPQIPREQKTETIFSPGEIEREATFSGRPSARAETSASETRQITVPIRLDSLPASGRLRIVFEVWFEVDSGSSGGKQGKKHPSRGNPMMRNLDVVQE